jgi:hypothetical protein
VKKLIRFIKNIIFYKDFLLWDYHDDWSSENFIENLIIKKLKAHQQQVHGYNHYGDITLLIGMLRGIYLEPWHDEVISKYKVPVNVCGIPYYEDTSPYPKGSNYFQEAEEFRAAYFQVLFDLLDTILTHTYGYKELSQIIKNGEWTK